MTCKHDNADHLKPGEWFMRLDGDPVRRVTVEQFRCLDCGAWLSMGPAHDTPEVLVEIRAAEIAAGMMYIVIGLERDGWDEWAAPSVARSYRTAGYLARAIVEHDTEVAP